MTQPQYIPFDAHQNLAEEDMIRRAFEFRQEMQTRRSVRQFSDRAVPREIIEECLQTAGSAPSGANLQPWHFVVISDSAVKRQIRLAAEQEEHEFYTRRAPPEWMAALAPLGTDEHKPFLEIAPYLIAIFALNNSQLEDGRTVKNYYVSESVGISTGMLITALHHAGLACLTHTPSPMKFLNRILNRPPNERPYLLLVVGYPAPEAVVPDISKKSLDQIASFV
ncbi:MAG: nitroreductase family protein [Chloroflexi bacterium]|nr:nitroreductase family protein [Chloroflexota bacterium]